MEDNKILTLTFQFSLNIISFCEKLENEKKFIIARQLLKAGTSIGANVREAQNPESREDFIHKIKVAIKEAEETEYWWLLCKESATYPTDEKFIENDPGNYFNTCENYFLFKKCHEAINSYRDTLVSR